MRLGAVLLAAGQGRRFAQAQPGAGSKLLIPVDGKPLVCYAMDALAALRADQTAVVTGDERIARLARERGFGVVVNDQPERGQGHSIALGADALREAVDALLLLAADQPRLTADSLGRLVRAYEAGGKGLACLRDETHWGNPAVFSRGYFASLCALDGDRGARRILLSHEDDLLIVPCLHPGELADVDTPQALSALSPGGEAQ